MLIRQATAQSDTFRKLVDAINASDGLVFIEEGKCGNGMRSCFVNVTMAGTHRILWVMVDPRGRDCEVMGLIGHELRHTVEVLAAPKVTNASAMYLFYSQQADSVAGPAFETSAAQRAGETVRTEVRRKSRCTNVR
jgi:hypothetical protein